MKAVAAGKLHHVSASQLNTYADPRTGCKRKWWFEKVSNLPREDPDPTGALARGTKTHLELEAYFNDWTLPPDGSLAWAAISHIPPPQTDAVHAEVEILPPLLIAGVPVEGYIDLLDLREAPADIQITDYKTGNPQYAKTADELRRNVQLMAYALWANQTYNAAWYWLRHINVSAPDVPAKIVSVAVSRSEVLEFAEGFAPVVEAMKLTANLDTADEVEPNYNACMAYNRPCQYLYVCGKTPAERMRMQLIATQGDPMIATGINPPDAPVVTRTRQPVTPITPESERGFQLYVDSFPDAATTYTSLDAYVGTLTTALQERHGVVDIRVAPNAQSPLAYNGWKGLLAAEARAHPPTGTLVGRSGELSTIVVEALSTFGTVTRGVWR